MISPETNETVIEEFLEGQPRAAVWRELREALAGRFREAKAVRDALPADSPAKKREEIEARVRELDEQINALAIEEAVTQFVEDSVRSSLARPAPLIDIGDEFDDEF